MADKKSTSLVGSITDRLNDLADKVKGKLPGDLVKDAAESLSNLTKDTKKLAAAESLTAARAVVKAQKKLAEQALNFLESMSRVPEKITDRLTTEKSSLPPEARTILKQWATLTRDTRKQFRQTLLESFDQAIAGLNRAEKELKAESAGPAQKSKPAQPAKPAVKKSPATGKAKPVNKSGKAADTAKKKATKPAGTAAVSPTPESGESGGR